jgi:hypothetical protein
MVPKYMELQSAPEFSYYKLLLEYEFAKPVGLWRAEIKTHILRVVYQLPYDGRGCFQPLSFYPVHPNLLKFRNKVSPK